MARVLSHVQTQSIDDDVVDDPLRPSGSRIGSLAKAEKGSDQMSIFAKKQDFDHKGTNDVAAAPAPNTTTTTAGRKDYGIAEAIQLMRGLPVDQNPDLVVRVVRATL